MPSTALAAAPQRQPRLHWEQALILAVAAVILALGIDWGLPSRERVQLLTGGSPLSEAEIRLLDSVRNTRRENRDARLAQAAEKLTGAGEFESAAGETLRASLSVEDKLNGLCSFLIHSSAEDEEITYSSLSRIDPRRLDLAPRYFLYGGAYLYPLGALLYAARALDLFVVTTQYSYYLHDPADMARIYTVGRSVSVAAFLAILLLLRHLTTRLCDRVAATGAMLTFAMSTVVLNQAVVSKPHLYAAFWALLCVTFLLRHLERGERRFLLLSGAAAGWAIGSSLANLALAAVFPIVLWGSGRHRSVCARTLVAWGALLATFLVTNPYVLAEPSRFLYTIVEATSADTWGYSQASIAKLWTYLMGIAARDYCFPATLVAFGAIAVALARKRGPIRRLAVATLLLMLALGTMLSNARVSLFVCPLLCLFAGLGFSDLRRLASLTNPSPIARAVFVAIGVAFFVPGLFFAGLFARDVIFDRNWHRPTAEWVREGRFDDSVMIGFFGRWWANQPHPTDSPPFPFVRANLVNMVLYGDATRLPDYVVVGVYADNRDRWAAHRLRPYYELTRELGDRESDDWFSGWRTRSLATFGAQVYEPKERR